MNGGPSSQTYVERRFGTPQRRVVLTLVLIQQDSVILSRHLAARSETMAYPVSIESVFQHYMHHR